MGVISVHRLLTVRRESSTKAWTILAVPMTTALQARAAATPSGRRCAVSSNSTQSCRVDPDIQYVAIPEPTPERSCQISPTRTLNRRSSCLLLPQRHWPAVCHCGIEQTPLVCTAHCFNRYCGLPLRSTPQTSAATLLPRGNPFFHLLSS